MNTIEEFNKASKKVFESELYSLTLDELKDKILSGYLYQIGSDRMVCVTGKQGILDYIELCKDMPASFTQDGIYVLFKGNKDEPEDTLRFNTRYIKLRDIKVKEY
jgi:hypothetical protein